jgi:hypothetical protein
VAEERYREGKCRKLGQHPLAEGKVLIRDRQAKPQCVGRGITNEQHPAFPWPQEGHLACTVARHKLAANDQNAIEILKGISPVAWRNVNLIGNFDFTTGTSPVDIEALAERYENPDFWRRSLQEADDDGPAY